MSDNIFNGRCVGGPYNGKGLTHDRPTKLLIAMNHDSQGGEYRYINDNEWLWHPEQKEEPVSRLAEEQVEMQIRESGKTAPRITPEIIDQRIRLVKYHRFPDSTLMVCAIELMNGYHVVGEAGCSSPLTFDEIIAKRIAFDDARRKIWALEGYVLRNVLAGL
jgi:hypothetical protein